MDAASSREFIELESRLSLRRDNCCCIRAISQAFEEPDRGLLTPGGSYRCDDAIAFANSLPPEKRVRYRGNCVKFGFASLAIVPIRYREEVIGAVHLADRRPGQIPASGGRVPGDHDPADRRSLHRFRPKPSWPGTATSSKCWSAAHPELEPANANARLQQTAEDLERSNRDLEQFAYVASHDLQEPLRAVGGYVKLLERRLSGSLDAKAREFIAGAFEGAAAHGAAHPRSARLLARRHPRRRLRSHRPRQPCSSRPWPTCRPASNPPRPRSPTTLCPPWRWMPPRSCSSSRTSSAMPSSSAASSRPEVHVGAQRQDGRWVFSVRDNGIGIEPQYFERIFQIFQRLHTRKRYPGTGIGLAICKKIVERHGGTIWVESQPGQGSTFYFSIPADCGIMEQTA